MCGIFCVFEEGCFVIFWDVILWIFFLFRVLSLIFIRLLYVVFKFLFVFIWFFLVIVNNKFVKKIYNWWKFLNVVDIKKWENSNYVVVLNL